MQSERSKSIKKWIVRVRFGLVPTIFGGLIVAFVVATQGAHYAWLLWIAVPLLMIGLGYLYVVSALPIFLNEVADSQSEPKSEDEAPEKQEPR